MFNLFKKKSTLEKLIQQPKDLLEEAHKLSKVNRKKSDQSIYEADLINQQIDNLKNNN